jgi:hypothetical protein
VANALDNVLSDAFDRTTFILFTFIALVPYGLNLQPGMRLRGYLNGQFLLRAMAPLGCAAMAIKVGSFVLSRVGRLTPKSVR